MTTDPTLFEYLRRSFDIPSHQVLPVNGEDRPQEEFFTFGAGDHFGVEYRSEMLSLHRHKLNRTAQQLAEATLPDDQLLRVQQARQGLLHPRPARRAAGRLAPGSGVLGALAAGLRRLRPEEPAR